MKLGGIVWRDAAIGTLMLIIAAGQGDRDKVACQPEVAACRTLSVS